MTPEPACIVALFRLPWKTEARCGRLSAPRAARMVVEGLPHWNALLYVCVVLEWITIERLTPALVTTAAVVPRSAAESPGIFAICAKLAFLSWRKQ
jgi:hypothetical protein